MGLTGFFKQGSPDDPLAETASQRANRMLGPSIASLRFFAWLLLCEALIAGYAAFWSADAPPRAQGIVTGLAILGAAAFAIGTAWVTLWISSPVRQRNEARTELARIHEEGERRSIEGIFRVDRRSIRLGIKNTGVFPVPAGTLINFLVPQTWKVFQPTDHNGTPVRQGELAKSDDDLTARDGSAVPAWRWIYRTTQSIEPGVTTFQHFQIDQAELGEYPIQLQVVGHGFQNHFVELTEDDESDEDTSL
jgi:hypothetical protein